MALTSLTKRALVLFGAACGLALDARFASHVLGRRQAGQSSLWNQRAAPAGRRREADNLTGAVADGLDD
ncbi:hypothetical protein ACQP00_21705 [Dactylosporangium sp. CS-047395]|uniref:hypothetical protein n=1 Tax=Dactylosporangium sp. CS-047395 TaxID=3239936 RepID=UPI003D8C7059